jgi:hypothetical protein
MGNGEFGIWNEKWGIDYNGRFAPNSPISHSKFEIPHEKKAATGWSPLFD